MKIKSISASIGRTFNTGNYESTRVDVAMTAEIDEGEDRDACRRELVAECKTAVITAYNQIKAPKEQSK